MPVYPPDQAKVLAPGLIANIFYHPVSQTVVVATTSMSDIDATNVKISFVAPVSGAVIIKASARGHIGSPGPLRWALREGSIEIPNTAQEILYTSTGVAAGRVNFTAKVTSLTPGTTYTYKLAQIATSGTCNTYYGSTEGPIVMEVWDAAPAYSTQVLTGVRPFKKTVRTAGNVAVGTTIFNVDTALDITVLAQIGDVIECNLNGAVGQANGSDATFDFATIVSGAVVNYVSGLTLSVGIGSWYIPNTGGTWSYPLKGSAPLYTVVAGDLSSSGTITLRLRAIGAGGGGHVLFANTSTPLHVSVKNLGQAAA